MQGLVKKYQDWQLRRQIKFVKWWAVKRQKGELRTFLRMAEMLSCAMLAWFTFFDWWRGRFPVDWFIYNAVTSLILGFLTGAIGWVGNERKYNSLLLDEKIKVQLKQNPETAKLLLP